MSALAPGRWRVASHPQHEGVKPLVPAKWFSSQLSARNRTEAAHGAAKKMTTHEGADTEIAALKKRYDDVKAVADAWVSKVDVLLKEWVLLDTTDAAAAAHCREAAVAG